MKTNTIAHELDNSIPGGEWLEYDSAADWCAARGIAGNAGDAIPVGLSERAAELIGFDVEAFADRVRQCAYARSMRKLA